MKHMRRLMQIAEDYSDYELAGDDPLASIPKETLARLAQNGFNIREPLYHGSNEQFTALDRQRVRTASHLYTSPDPATAGAYGRHLYLCLGRTDPQANLIDDYQLIGRLAEQMASDYFDAVETDEDLEALRQALATQLREADPEMDEFDLEDAVTNDPRYRAQLLRGRVSVSCLLIMMTSSF